MKIAPINNNRFINIKSKQRNINFGESESTDRFKGKNKKNNDAGSTQNADTFKKSHAQKTYKARTLALSSAAFLVIGAAIGTFKDNALEKIQNCLVCNSFDKDSKDFARNLLEKKSESDKNIYDDSDEIMIVQNMGKESFVEITKKEKDGTTVRYKVECPMNEQGVKPSLTYEDIKDITIGQLIEEKKISQMGIDIDSDGNEEISFEFENGDINNTTTSYDFDSDGKTDKKITTIIEDFN